ncbi:hypothetical protein NDU88_001475 [Pleurodeles waltl]|uniref:Uncharacterized protein n=1 Tax=Pleurodeles waltl TaxID=8319 RepID=A0AAV7MUS4_PLEWA|nr:hypothetical protein NDU88_001475 [Pleurodeles waltl]
MGPRPRRGTAVKTRHCDFALRISVPLSAPPRVSRAPRHSRASTACALASLALPRLSRPAAILIGSRAPSGTPAPGHFYSPARGSGLGRGLSLSRAACPYLLQFPAQVGRDPRGLRPLRPRWAATSGPGPGQQSPLRRGEAGPRHPGRPPFLSLRLRAARPRKGAQESSLSYSLYRRSRTSDSGFGSITGAASGRHGTRHHFGYWSRWPESDPDPVSLPGFLSGQGTSQGRQAVV